MADFPVRALRYYPIDPRLCFTGPSAPPPTPPPPPPNPPTTAAPSVMEQSAAEAARLASAEGAGFGGTVETSGQGAPNPKTTRSLLGQ